MDVSDDSETPSATVELQLEFRHSLLKEQSIVMTNLTRPLLGMLFLQRNSTILDMRQRFFNFTLFSIQLEHADYTYSNINETLLSLRELIIKPEKQTD